MKGGRKMSGYLAGLLALLLLCGCSRVRVPEEELQAAGKPVEGVPADPQPDWEPSPDPEEPQPEPAPKLLLEAGLCALLPGAAGEYVIYDCYGNPTGTMAAGAEDLAGVYAADAILAGCRLSDGSPVLPDASPDAHWVQDAAGFTVYDPQAGLLYRLDAAGTLQFFCSAPAEASYVSLFPMDGGFLASIWSGSGTDADPWKLQAPCVLLNDSGGVAEDLTGWITGPVLGVLGGEYLLLARAGDTLADVYDLTGNCLAQGVRPIRAEGSTSALGGTLCEYVWKDGWICSAGLQPQQACPDPEGLVLCGEHFSGVIYDIDGIDSNGKLLPCGEEAAVWAVEDGLLAIQWQGINYHFDAGKRQHEQLQLCSKTMAVSYAWDADGSGCFRLLFLNTGAILEYNVPGETRVSALLQEEYALFAAAGQAAETGDMDCRFWVVDAAGALRYESAQPLLPCKTGSYLLCREESGVSILDLDGNVVLSGAAP